MRLLRQIHSHIITRPLPISTFSFSLSKIISFCALSPLGNIQYAQKLLFQSPNPNIFSFNSLIRGLSQSQITPTTQPFSIFKHLISRGHPHPNTYTIAFVLKSCSGFEGQQVHSRVMRSGFASSSFLQCSLVDFYAKCEEIECARKVFDEMSERNVIAWSVMISGYVKIELCNEALGLFGDMQKAGVVPDEVTMASVVTACGGLGALDVGKWVHAYIKKRKIVIDTKLSTALINMYAKCGCIERAKEVFDEMPVKDSRAWSSMIVGFAIHGLAEDALSIFASMEESKWYQSILDPMETRKQTLEQFQQQTNETLNKFSTMFEKLMREVQSLKEKSSSSASGSGKGAMVVTGGEMKPYLKLHFPRFSGDDPTGWIYQSEQYFEFQAVAPEDRVNLASFHLDGIALQWHRWYTKTRGPMTWLEFTAALLSRFGPTDYEDPSESLHRLKQLTTVAAYVEAFERLSHCVDGLPEAFLVGCFIGGLKEEIRLEVKLKKPRNLTEAIGVARLVEEKLSLQHVFSSPQGLQTVSSPQNPSSNVGLLGSGPAHPLALPAPNTIRRITSTAARERREKGLCYYCDERYTPGHKCSKPQLFMINDVCEDVNEPPRMAEDVIQAEISFLAISGNILPQTLRLLGKINTKDVVVLVDGGSTHNFISQELVNQLGLTVDYDVKFEVVVANSETLVCGGTVRNLTIRLSGYTVTTDFFVLPVAAFPIVMGIQWLRTLGPIEINFEDLTIGFRLSGSSHKLYGLKRSRVDKSQATQFIGVQQSKKPYPVFRLEDKASVRGVDCYVPRLFPKSPKSDNIKSKKSTS